MGIRTILKSKKPIKSGILENRKLVSRGKIGRSRVLRKAKMEHINIYIINTIKQFSGGWGYVGYILEAFRDNIPVTVQGFFKIREKPNRADLLIIIEALGRLTRQCDVHIYTRSQQIYNAFEKEWLKKWERDNWMTSKGEPVKNADLWKLLLFRSNSYVTVELGVKHQYYDWMERYIKENEDKIEVIGDEQEK